MSQTPRALLCVAACFVLALLCFLCAEWCDRKGRVAKSLAEMVLAPACVVFVALGGVALIGIGLETGHLARAYHLARDHRDLTPMLLALVPPRIR